MQQRKDAQQQVSYPLSQNALHEKVNNLLNICKMEAANRQWVIPY
jgi:hypothetical protein